MLRAAHYKSDAVDLPTSNKSPPKHRAGGILDLALTAADKYALSLLPAALKGTALAGSDAQATDARGSHFHSPNGPSYKVQRGSGNPMLQTMPLPPHFSGVQQQAGDSRVANSWDASLKEILAALAPDNRTLKPAKLRDHRYPNQNHGLPTKEVIPPPRRELDESLITLHGGTRRNKAMQSYTATLKGLSRQGRRPEVQNVDVQYDVVPGVKLAWTGPGAATYSTTGYGGSSKKYTSQLVGRVSPHYAGMPAHQPQMGAPSVGQESIHLPEISVNGSYRAGSYMPPSYQPWTQTVVSAMPLSHSTNPRKALPYVSSNVPSLAKPLAVQYHPVLKSSQMGQASSVSQSPLPSTAAGLGSRSTPQQPATDQGTPPRSAGFTEGVGPGSRRAQGVPTPYRLPHTPPEVAAEVARLRHAQELDGVINAVRGDLQLVSSPRNDVHVKSKFLQMYEDPNRPLARLNPKHLLADMLPPPAQQHRRPRPPGLSVETRASLGGAVSPGGGSSVGRSPMYERRLRPLPSTSQNGTDGELQEAADDGGLRNVHLQPPEALSSSAVGAEQLASANDALQAPEAEFEAAASGMFTPQSSMEHDDTALLEPELVERATSGTESGVQLAADLLEGAQNRQERPSAEGERGAIVDHSEELASSTQEADQPEPASTAGPETASAPQELVQETEAGSAVRAAIFETPTEPIPAPSFGDEVRPSGVLEPLVEPSATAEWALDTAAPQQTTQGAASTASLPRRPNQVEGPAAVDAKADVENDRVPCPTGCACSEEPDVAAAAEAAVHDPSFAQKATAALEGEEAEAPSSLEASAGAAEAEISGLGEEDARPVEASQDADASKTSRGDGATAAGPVAAAEGAEADAASAPDGDAEMAGSAQGTSEATEPAPDVGGSQFVEADAAPEIQPEMDVSSSAAGHAQEAVAVPHALLSGWTSEYADAPVVLIQAHIRGHLARRQVAALRQARSEAAQAEQASAEVPSRTEPAMHPLPPGVTPEMMTEAVVRIQSHARGYLARRHVAELRKGREAGEAALATAVTAAAGRKVGSYELPPGVTPEMAAAAATLVQAHMRGHLARRQVKVIRAVRRETAAATASGQLGGTLEDHDPLSEAGPKLHEAGKVASSAVEPEEQPGAAPHVVAAAADAGVEETQAITIDALKAALADDDEEDGDDLDGKVVASAEDMPVDMSDPATVAAAAAAAAAAKGVTRAVGDTSYSGETVADTTAAADQAAVEASMARLAASSARTSAMFQGAGAEMRYSDDEASALELMDNLDGLLQGDDEAAAVAAAVAAAAAPAEGELVSISADGVSAPQALRASSSGGAANPMDTLEPGGVRVLAGKYEVQHVVGEGAYGMVMKCKVRGTDPVQWVAIKEFKIDDNDPDAEDVKRTSLREVAVLEVLHHPHVVGFVDKFMVGDRLFIVMEFLPCNLLELLEAQPGGMDRDAVRLIMFQLCSAIAFIHSKGMVYRDIKPENLLVDEHGTVKLCDFGFARYLPSTPDSHLTDYVATRWYRAPELLLGPPYRDSTGKHIQYMYGPQVDMWAVGCLMGELLDGEPLFAGDSDLDQLYRVQQILGPMAPSHQYLFYANPHNTGIVFNIKQPVTLAARYRGKMSDVELSFMLGLLEMDPEKRMTGEQCLQHPYLVDLAVAATTLPGSSPSASLSTAPEDVITNDGSGGQVMETGVTLPQTGSGHVGDVAPVSLGDAAGHVSPSPLEPGMSRRGSEAMGSRELEKAGSLTRARGSLTQGGRTLSRGSVSPVMTQTKGSSPVPGSGPLRKTSVLQAGDNGQVVIVEGVVEGDEEDDVTGVATVKSVSTLAEMAAVVSEIEPADD